MAELNPHRELIPRERLQVALAAELFGWLDDAELGERSRTVLTHLFSQLNLPLSDITEMVSLPEVAMTMLCEVSAEVRAAVTATFRFAPVYLELATCEGFAARQDRLRHAGWLYLNPGAARIALLRHEAQLPFQPTTTAELLSALDGMERDAYKAAVHAA